MLVPVIGPVISPAAQVADKDTPKCPGMKYKHYAPEAQVVVLEYTGTLDHARLTAMADSAHASGKRVGVLSCENTGNIYGVELFTTAAAIHAPMRRICFMHCARLTRRGLILSIVRCASATRWRLR